jgi:predicted phage tail protein
MSGVAIHLHGRLGRRLGRELVRLRVVSPAEAVRALCTMLPGAREALESGAYQVVRQAGAGRLRRQRSDQAETLHRRFSPGEGALHIVPRVRGRKRGGFAKIILGTLLVAASFFIPGAGLLGAGVVTPGAVLGIGVSMALGGLAQLFAPKPKRPDSRSGERETSNLFADSQNNADPGSAIPVVFGVAEVGSVVVSAAIKVEDRT